MIENEREAAYADSNDDSSAGRLSVLAASSVDMNITYTFFLPSYGSIDHHCQHAWPTLQRSGRLPKQCQTASQSHNLYILPRVTATV